MTGPTVLLVDDQALIRLGLRVLLEASDVVVVGEAADGRTAYTNARSLLPDVILMDLRMPEVGGIEATRLIRGDPALDQVRVLVLTTFDDDPDVLAAVRAGADGFLSKSAGTQELLTALTAVAQGRASLSDKALRAVMQVTAAAPAERDGSLNPDLARRAAELTRREREVVAALASGIDLAAISRALFISPHTTKTHVNRAMAKLGARDRGQLVALAFQAGIS